MFKLCLFLACWPVTLILCAQNPAFFPEREPEWRGAPVSDEGVSVFQAAAMIEGFDLDTVDHIIYLTLRDGSIDKPRDNGRLVAYHMETASVLWQREMNYNTDRFFLQGNIPLYCDRGRSYALDPLSGRTMWSSQVVFEFCAPGKMLCMGKYGRHGKSLFGVDLDSGQKAWEYEGTPLENMESFTLAGDSGIVIFSRGIHYINFRSGTGFSHKAKDSFVNPTRGFYTSYFFFGVLGAAVVELANSKKNNPSAGSVGNEMSNVVVHDENIFFATVDEVISVDFEGNVQWKYKQPGPAYEMSKIFVHNEMVYVINAGRPVSDGSVHGIFYFSALNRLTGRPHAEIYPGFDTAEYLTDFYIRDSTIVLAKSDGVAEYALDDLTVVRENSFGDPVFGSGLDKIVSPPYFVMADGKLENRSETGPDGFYIENRAGMKIEFTPEFELNAVVRKPQFFQFKQRSSDLTVLENGSDAVVLNGDLKILNTPELTRNVEIIGSHLYDFHEDKLMIIPVASLTD